MGATGINFLVQQVDYDAAFHMQGHSNEIRIVTLFESETGLSPSQIIELANSNPFSPEYKSLLELIFKYGQNEFQDSRTNRSVSVGDVIHVKFQDRTGIGYRLHEVLPQGFKTLTEAILVSAMDLRQRFSQAS